MTVFWIVYGLAMLIAALAVMWFDIPSDPSNAGPNWRHEPDPEPFYTEGLPCESCGKPCESRSTASWDPDLQVGKCCEIGLLTFPNRIRTSVATWYWKWQWERGKIKFTMQNRRKDL